jgi:GNAT superfamily N-acetyltransferase
MSNRDPPIRRATERDRPTVLHLLAEYLPFADVEARYEWLYVRNPHGAAATFVAVDPDTGTPMGLTSLFPRRVLVDGKVRLGSIGGDGYVRPAYRRRGVATALHRACRAAMCDGGIEFMYGAPEPNNLIALLRAGSAVATQVRRYGCPSRLQRVMRSLPRLGVLPRPELVPLDGLDRRVAALWDLAASGSRVIPVRDPAYYAWRFGRTPTRAQRAFALLEGGRAAAVCALERAGGRVAVVDLLAPPGRLAATLRAVALAADAEVLTMAVNEHGPETETLWRAGFMARESKEFQVLAPAGHPAAWALYDASSWYYTWGDGDVDRVLSGLAESRPATRSEAAVRSEEAAPISVPGGA